jgi:hypothetical protein
LRGTLYLAAYERQSPAQEPMTNEAFALRESPLSRARFVWMFGQRIDLAFLFLPAILAPLVFIIGQSSLLIKSALWTAVFLNAFGLGDFHVGITWLNYFDRKNLSFYNSSLGKKLIYSLGPPAIVILTIVGSFLCPAAVATIYMAWSVQHLVQQNVGLLLLYHNHGQNEAIVNRTLEVKSLHLAAIFFSLLFAQRIFLMQLAQFAVWKALVILVGVAFVGAVLLYLREMIVQLRRGAYLNVPAFLFWCLSIYFFAPFAFLGKSFLDAILIANIMHWAQYIGIMFVLVLRKYKDEQLKNLPLSHPILLFFLMGFGGLALLEIGRVAPANIIHSSPFVTQCVLSVVLGFGMVHYFQDAFMWRFREQYYRETVLSYLRQKS